MPTCPVCYSSSFHEKFQKNTCRFIECDGCGFISIFPLPTPTVLTTRYDQTYYRSWGMHRGDDPVVREMKMKTASALLKEVALFRSPGRLLDIGCAAGHFLEAAAQQAWEVYGVEISDYSAALAKEKFSDRIYAGSFETAPYPEEFFDCIIMSDVLEHFPAPGPVLDKIQRLLKDRGVLLIVTPDTGSLSARLLNKTWNHYEKEHLIYFNRKNIQICLKKYGLLPRIVKPSHKAMSLKYMHAQMTAYTHPVFTPMIRLINGVLPHFLLVKNFWVRSGDMLVIAKKEERDIG